jgi:arginyl-tRNA synthetase
VSVGIIHTKVSLAISEALLEAKEQGLLNSDSFPVPSVDFPKKEEWGDLSSNVAMSIAKQERKPPREVADIIANQMKSSSQFFEHIDIAPPGFLNFTLRRDCWHSVLLEVEEQGDRYGNSAIGQGRRVLLEFVSANPTGPLHMGHGRGAALGEALARLLRAAGYSVEREYYINDAGRQMKLLSASVYARYRELEGQQIEFPEDGYHGAYIKELAQGIREQVGTAILDLPSEEAQAQCGQLAYEKLLGAIKDDLAQFGINFETWYSEASLFSTGKIHDALADLEKRDLVFKEDGAVWFRSSQFKDEKDRVVCKQNGDYTYLASDIAYHYDKLTRGFDWLINIWGADHHGYVPRMQGAVEAFGYPKDRLQVVLVQMVSLLRGGQKVEMSKRSGEFVTLQEVAEEVGADAAKFFFLMRRADTHLEFDLELAKKQSSENPVYYVQYAHARLASLFRIAQERGLKVPAVREADLSLLAAPEEFRLIKHVSSFPGLIESCAQALEPHRISFYLQELAGLLHAFYYKHRVLPPKEHEINDGGGNQGADGEEREVIRETVSPAQTLARLALLQQVKTVLHNGLSILGVSAPEKM